MERSSDHNDLATALAEARPELRETFAEELDGRVAAGFPRPSRLSGTPLGGFAGRLRELSPQRLLFAMGSGALAAIAIASVIVTSQGPNSQPPVVDGHALQPDWRGVQFSAAPTAKEGEQASRAASGETLSAAANLVPFSRRTQREIERSARIALLAEPADVADDSGKVFAAVHDADGIVLHSTTSSGSNAGARFALLIPSARLGDALAAISSIDEVSSRHEATDDITAPTVSTRGELQNSRARIDTLLAQLSSAETETEAAAVEAELRGERRHAARLRARLANLDRRTTYSHIAVRIESDPAADSGGTWGFDDAVGDAGHILAVAAAVTLVGLAIAAPIALIAFLAWLAHRLWLRTRRERALDA